MTTEQKIKHIKLLRTSESVVAKSILFYLTNTESQFERKKQFVEKVLDKYVEIFDTPFEFHADYEQIPQEILLTLTSSYNEDMEFIQYKDEEALIAEMNEIF